MNKTAPLVVVGAGAAGLMAAWGAATLGVPTVLLEGSRHAGAKILISGGGRCNVLPGEFNEQAFYTQGSRNVLRRIFRTWPHAAVRRFFEEELRLPLCLEVESGKLFPEANRARVVRDALVQAAQDRGVDLRLNWRVASIEATASGFRLYARDAQHEPLEAQSVILASGGKSVPKTGSDGTGYGFAKHFGHSLLPTYPALVPLTHNEPDLHALSGIALPVAWTTANSNNKVLDRGAGAALFTHQGMSGPAILDASHWVEREGARLELCFGLEHADAWTAQLTDRDGAHTVGQRVHGVLPRRVASCLLQRAKVAESQPVAQLTRAQRQQLLQNLAQFELPITGSRGFAVAEVTGGGIPLGEVQPSTLESRTQPGLYLCGEILDCIGRIGGHNFLWAWVTGKLAGMQAARAWQQARAASKSGEA